MPHDNAGIQLPVVYTTSGPQFGVPVNLPFTRNYSFRNQQQAISPIELEKQKDAEQKAEDLAYTINHAIACTATDVIDPYVNKWIQNRSGHYAPNWLKPYLAKLHIGCGHNHNEITTKQAFFAEGVGDFGSVGVVIAAQRFAPGVMRMMEHAIEPFVGAAFHKSAEKATDRWAQRYGLSNNSEEYQQHLEEIYHHEVSHLPQAVLWTISSVGLNAVAQRVAGVKNPWSAMIAGKTGGALVTSGLVVGTRLFAPKGVRTVDKWTTKNIIAPTTRVIGGAIGIDQEAMEHVLEHQEDKAEVSWEEKMQGKEGTASDIETQSARGRS